MYLDNVKKDERFFCSWSGGKDSTLALYRAIQDGGTPKGLLTMLTEGGLRSRSHGLPVELIQAQADSLKIPLTLQCASWDDYEKNFISVIGKFVADDISCGVFGDIDLDPHREWVERVCSLAEVRAVEPLWKTSRRELLHEFIELGFKAVIVVVKDDLLDASFLGRTLDYDLIDAMEQAGCDASGEKGEYHSVVIDGPIFSTPIELETKSQLVRDGYRFLDVGVKTL